MRIVDHVYANTLVAIATDIMSQIEDSENFVSDIRNEEDEYKQEVRDKIPEMVEMVAPVLINMSRAFKWSISEEMESFIKKYNIKIPEEK